MHIFIIFRCTNIEAGIYLEVVYRTYQCQYYKIYRYVLQFIRKPMITDVIANILWPFIIIVDEMNEKIWDFVTFYALYSRIDKQLIVTKFSIIMYALFNFAMKMYVM